MKGLILKDIYCLRTRMMAYIMTMVAALVLGILISLSSEYGNLRFDVFMAGDASITEDDMASYKIILGGGTFLAVLISLGVGFDGIMTFHMDEKANFNDVLRSMPVKPEEIVLARYITTYGFLLLSYVSSVLVALMISPVVKMFSLGEMIYAGTVLACALAIGLGVSICALFLWNKKTFDRIFVGAFVGAYALFAIAFIVSDTYYENRLDAIMGVLMDKGKILYESCLLWLLPVAILMVAVCYFVSVWIIKRKGRGVR